MLNDRMFQKTYPSSNVHGIAEIEMGEGKYCIQGKYMEA